MIYGAINHKGEPYYTDLKKVFDSIGNIQKQYNWLITDCDCYPADPRTAAILQDEYCWISGENLTDLVNNENFQWIWAVLSAFDKGTSLSDVLRYDLPYADGYEGFWKLPLTIQHPLARIEIVPWDSSLTLIFSDDKSVIDSFTKAFPESENLVDYIKNFE